MARTQAADYDAKRDAITSHAAKLFARKGFAGASISELAESCAVSKSLIYHYYPSKEAILFDVMNEHIDDLLRVVHSDKTTALSPEDEFTDLAKKLLRRYVGAAGQQKVLLYELEALPNDLKSEIIDKQRKIIARVEDVLGKAKPALLNDRKKLRAKVMLFFGMLNWTHTWFKPKGAVSRDELAEMAADVIWKSL
jgi:AcrR family transcriptional regulator